MQPYRRRALNRGTHAGVRITVAPPKLTDTLVLETIAILRTHGDVAAASAATLLAPTVGMQAAQADAKLRFGANYVPRKNWWYCWLDWDQQAIVEDLTVIASLGLDHIRIQCLWPFFQPGITNVNERVLANLHALLDAAAGVGLDVEVTVLNGWMSGLSFLPAWVAPLKKPSDPAAGNSAIAQIHSVLRPVRIT